MGEVSNYVRLIGPPSNPTNRHSRNDGTVKKSSICDLTPTPLLLFYIC